MATELASPHTGQVPAVSAGGYRTVSHASGMMSSMATVKADEVRIPKSVRDAVSRHERVLVLSRDHPVLAIVHPDDAPGLPAPRGVPVRELGLRLASLPVPDEEFAADMAEVLELAGEAPEDPWGQS
jgi:hypothetical protein